MHDVIRDMALWLAWERGEKKNKFLVADVVSGGDHCLPTMTQWKNAEKVSLWGRGITVEYLARLSFCSNLATLFIHRSGMSALPIEIFPSIKNLKVLDLSDGNESLTELPAEIGSLVNLEYLNVIGSRVRILPVNVQLLKKLRFLFLNETTLIPRGVISNLGLLQSFEQALNMAMKYLPGLIAMRREMFGELEGLEQIRDVSFTLRESESMQILLDSPMLLRCTRALTLHHCQCSSVFDLCTAGRLMDHLEELILGHCEMSVIKLSTSSLFLGNLREVIIDSCDKVRNVSSLIYITNLCSLKVRTCASMEELINANDIDMMRKKKMEESRGCYVSFDDPIFLSLFSSLTYLHLFDLRKLRSICPQTALPFPSLKELEVLACPSLKKLPFDSNTAKTTPPEFKIKGNRDWWDDILQWDSQGTKNAFTPKFQHTPTFMDESPAAQTLIRLRESLITESLMCTTEVGLSRKV